MPLTEIEKAFARFLDDNWHCTEPDGDGLDVATYDAARFAYEAGWRDAMAYRGEEVDSLAVPLPTDVDVYLVTCPVCGSGRHMMCRQLGEHYEPLFNAVHRARVEVAKGVRHAG